MMKEMKHKHKPLFNIFGNGTERCECGATSTVTNGYHGRWLTAEEKEQLRLTWWHDDSNTGTTKTASV